MKKDISGKQKKLVDFDISALFEALDTQRNARELGWTQVAREMWEMAAELNLRRPYDHPISPTSIISMSKRGDTTCQHALIFLQWLDRSPESFLPGLDEESNGSAVLPTASKDRRLRWNLRQLYYAVNARRQELQMTWPQLALVVGCTPNQLIHIRTARFAIGMKLAMRIVQWLNRPAADFIYAAQW